MKYELNIANMTCQHCAKRVQNALQALYPKAEVVVDLTHHKATVEPIEDFNVDALAAAIDEAGYTLEAWTSVNA